MARLVYDKDGRLLFTKEMRKEYTMIFPMMAPIHFRILKEVFNNMGYHAELLETTGPEIAQTGLKYVHNDTCYPAILAIGQLIHAVQFGKYDTHKIALMITQTGGGCRASNYIHLLRKALARAGLGYVPVVSLNLSGMEKNPGFKLTLSFIRRAIAGLIYGDTLMLLKNQCEPYEINKGETNALVEKWSAYFVERLSKSKGYSLKEMKRNIFKLTDEFALIKCDRSKPKLKVGVVGEIYVKYSSLGNNSLEDFLKDQDCEVNLPMMLGFILFKIDNRLEDIRLYGGSKLKKIVCTLLLDYCTKTEDIIVSSISRYDCFNTPGKYAHLKSLVKDVIGYGDKMGEGWLLTAEMMELVESGYENIVCTQPFGCLPNHIGGKGMIRRIVELMPNANIVAVDYDAGAVKVNQENRIKLMLSIGRENMLKK